MCSDGFLTLLKLEKFSWTHDNGSCSYLSSENVPSLWFDLSLKRLATSHLNLRSKSLLQMTLDESYFHYDRIFLIGHNRERGGMIGSLNDHPSKIFNLTLSDFIHSSNNPNKFLFSKGNILSLKELKLFHKESQSIFKSFNIHNNNNNNSNNNTLSEYKSNTYLTHPGVIIQTQYQSDHQYYIQLKGKKTILLFHPSVEFYLYPNIHLANTQSKIHLEKYMNNDSCPLFHHEQYPLAFPMNTSTYTNNSIPAISVTLLSGDILYIPPYWYYWEESLSLSLSLSIRFPSVTELTFLTIYDHPVPFGNFQNTTILRKMAVIYYLNILFTKLEINETVSSFANHLYETRFQHLYPLHIEEIYSKYNPKEEFCPVNETILGYKSLLVTSEVDFINAVNITSSILMNLNCDIFIKKRFLGDYVEQMIRWAVGPQKTARFLRDCLPLNLSF